ncbi:hypothetical protein JHK82_042371 [Glycine max]|nr:hypothetical protein JHK86_042413 [Glycine max]KAG5105401.1 hypothetical protein JHK82_042371 [Glycine max]KAG5116528.1 hypothetical protein JHK84_042641 [Glycine max]
MAMSVARLKKDEIQRLKKEIDSVWRPAMELHELETSAVLKNLLEDRERMRRAQQHHHHHRRCYSNPNPPHPQPALLVFFDGTAFNSIVKELKNFTIRIAHILPVFNDGGSTAKIVGSGDHCFVRTWNNKREPGTEKVRWANHIPLGLTRAFTTDK